MSVPTSPILRSRVGLVDVVGNFGDWPPTKAYKESRLAGQGVLLKIGDPAVADPAKAALQVAGIRSHGLVAGFWQPVPPAGDDGPARAKKIDDFLDAVELKLAALAASAHEWAKFASGKIPCVGLNLEGYDLKQTLEFLWGRPGGVRGWRGSNGQEGSSTGYRPGVACWWIDEPFKDGSVKPMASLKLAKMMLAVEEFLGKGFLGDMTPADGQRAIVDRIEGRRSDGSIALEEAWPPQQVVACYDAGRGVEIRYGLHFTLDRARQFNVI